MSEEYIRKAPMYAFKNREAVLQSQVCGCYNCLEVIQVEDIDLWTDDDETALCPKCTMDTLLPESLGCPLDTTSLMEIRDHWLRPSNHSSPPPKSE